MPSFYIFIMKLENLVWLWNLVCSQKHEAGRVMFRSRRRREGGGEEERRGEKDLHIMQCLRTTLFQSNNKYQLIHFSSL